MISPGQARHSCSSFVAVFSAFALLSVVPASWAQTTVSVSFTIIADTTTSNPDNSGATFADFSAPSIDDDGNVAFYAFDSAQNEGVYTSIGGSLDVVADKSTSIPGIGKPFLGFLLAPGQLALGLRQLSIDGGKVAFLAQIPDPSGVGVATSGIYTNVGGSLQEVARGDNAVGNFSGSNLSRPWLDGGTVAYGGLEVVPPPVGGFVGKINTFPPTTNVITSSDFDAFHQPSFGGGGVTVETILGQKELWIAGGPSAGTVVRVGDVDFFPVPGKSNVSFMNFSHFPVLDANSDIAFLGSGTDFLNGIYKQVGGVLKKVADTNTTTPGGPLDPEPGGSTTFPDFGTHVAIADGRVMFLGIDGSRVGLYTDLGGVLNEIVRLSENDNDVITIGPDSFTVGKLWLGSEGFAKTPTGYSAVFLAFLSEPPSSPFPAIVRADIRLDKVTMPLIGTYILLLED